MRGLPLFCLFTAALYALVAMGLGIFMAASHDHSLSTVHAHINLVGWVSVALYGFYYNAVPAIAETRLARFQVGMATTGVLLLGPGIGLAEFGITEGPAILGSIVTICSMLLFAAMVLRGRQRPAPKG